MNTVPRHRKKKKNLSPLSEKNWALLISENIYYIHPFILNPTETNRRSLLSAFYSFGFSSLAFFPPLLFFFFFLIRRKILLFLSAISSKELKKNACLFLLYANPFYIQLCRVPKMMRTSACGLWIYFFWHALKRQYGNYHILLSYLSQVSNSNPILHQLFIFNCTNSISSTYLFWNEQKVLVLVP